MGHLGPDALAKLEIETNGVKLVFLKTYQCDIYRGVKAREKIRRAPIEYFPTEPGEKISLDFYNLIKSSASIRNYKAVMLVIDRYSGFVLDFYLS